MPGQARAGHAFVISHGDAGDVPPGDEMQKSTFKKLAAKRCRSLLPESYLKANPHHTHAASQTHRQRQAATKAELVEAAVGRPAAGLAAPWQSSGPTPAAVRTGAAYRRAIVCRLRPSASLRSSLRSAKLRCAVQGWAGLLRAAPRRATSHRAVLRYDAFIPFS